MSPELCFQGENLVHWFKARGYRHFDRPVNSEFGNLIQSPEFVAKHSFSPFLQYVKEEKRYKRQEHKTIAKERVIMYASHKDACILTWYAHCLNARLEEFYAQQGLSDCVIAYRALGKGNYDFAAEAHTFAKIYAPVDILAFDITGFFDNLSHSLLKTRLKTILDVETLSSDWYKVYRAVTRFHFVARVDLDAHDILRERLKRRDRTPIASVAELKRHGIKFHPNPMQDRGIPQGTPISSQLSNLYMIDFDQQMHSFATRIGALYRRYSDDILMICEPSVSSEAENVVTRAVASNRLSLNEKKTERSRFDPLSGRDPDRRPAQYLGFTLGVDGVAIRSSSLSRQWRKMRRAIKRTRKVASDAISNGRSNKVYTKSLRRRFTAVPARNFSSYARRSNGAFQGSSVIKNQLRKFERAAEREISALKALERPTEY